MTKREAAIVSAYTGFLLGNFSDLANYAAEILGQSEQGVFDIEMADRANEIQEKSKKDFVNIKIE